METSNSTKWLISVFTILRITILKKENENCDYNYNANNTTNLDQGMIFEELEKHMKRKKENEKRKGEWMAGLEQKEARGLVVLLTFHHFSFLKFEFDHTSWHLLLNFRLLDLNLELE